MKLAKWCGSRKRMRLWRRSPKFVLQLRFTMLHTRSYRVTIATCLSILRCTLFCSAPLRWHTIANIKQMPYTMHICCSFFPQFHTPLFYCQPDTIIGHSKMWCYLQRQTCFAKSTFSQILIVQPFPWFLKRDACDVHWFVIIFYHYFFALNLYIDIYELLCRT